MRRLNDGSRGGASMRVLCIMCALCGASALSAQAAPDGAALLAKADAVLAPGDARFSMTMESVGGGKSVVSEYDCYNRGSSRFLMIFKAPASLVGQAQLKVDDTIYYYVRKVDKTIQQSAKQQFAGTLFTQEDVMSQQLSALYSVSSVSDVTRDGRAAYQLVLTGRTKDVTYREIRVWLDKGSGFPLRREYYAHSGQLVKFLTIDALKLDAAGRPAHVEMTMTDALLKGRSTRAIMDFLSYEPVNERYFSRSYLKVLTE